MNGLSMSILKNQSKGKPRVYLSKSKMGSMDTLLKVREMLSKYDIELIEFEGGEYTEDALLSCDVFLLLPPVLPKPFNYDFNVGKGQYSEIMIACKMPRYFIICVGDDIYVSNGIKKVIKIEKDWKLNFAYILCSDPMKPLHKYNDAFVLKSHLRNVTYGNNNKYNSGIKPLLACYTIFKK